jgi:hypothetical protein
MFYLRVVSVSCGGLWLVSGVREFFFCWGGVFGMHLCPFWYESMVIGGVFGFLSLWGGFFWFRCVTPLYVFFLVVVG